MFNLVLTTAVAACIASPIENSEMNLFGETTYKRAFIKLYDAALCGPSEGFSIEDSFALTLRYRRNFSSDQIVGASIHEMARLSNQKKSDIEPLRESLQQCFPDVKKGDILTGISEGPNKASFYLNDALSCQIEWSGFRDQFFGIWIGAETREPKRARKLMGISK